MIKKRTASLRIINLGGFPQGQHTEAAIQRRSRLYPRLTAALGCVRVNQVVLVLNTEKSDGDQLRLSTVWQDKSP